jgi:hypothetical protein
MAEAELAIRLPRIDVPAVLRVALKGFIDTLLKEIWTNVLHFEYSGGAPSVTDLAGLASAISTLWATNMAPECPSPTQLTEVDITDLTSATSSAAAWTGSHVGTRGDDSIPANAAVLISYPLTRRYQGGHPRTYLYVGGNADLQGAAEWATAFQAEALSHWHSFLNGIIGHTAGAATVSNLVNVSYVNKATGTPPHYYRATPLVDVLSLSTMFAQLGMASQRRRIGRGGDTEKAPRGGLGMMNIARATEVLAGPAGP